jgi:hypothetical protein
MKTAMQELIEKYTAVEWLYEKLGLLEIHYKNKTIDKEVYVIECQKAFKEALEKEKEQIIDAYNQGALDGESSEINYPNYYNQTYNQNK